MEEIWKDIKNFEGLYQVSNTGFIRSLDKVNRFGTNGIRKGKTLTKLHNSNDRTSYNSLTKDRVEIRVNITKVVAEHFLGYDPTDEDFIISLADGNKNNNGIDNIVIEQKEEILDIEVYEGFEGVVRLGKKKFTTNLVIEGRKKFLGNFRTYEEAYIAYFTALDNFEKRRPKIFTLDC